MARGDQLPVESLIATAQTVAPHVDLTGGFSVIPLTAIASTAADPRLPLFVTRTAAQKEAREGAGVELPGRNGNGAALLERLYGAQHRVTLLPSGETTTLQSVTADQSSAWEALLIPPLAPIEAQIRSGTAIAALGSDTKLAEENKISGSPTFLMNAGRQILYGNVGYRLIEANLNELLRAPNSDDASWC